MQVPVYLITGFLESGKTTFIEQVILEGNFVEDEKTLLILTEEGEAEIEPELLKQYNVDVVTVEDKEESPWISLKSRREHRPQQVIIEYNGMWPVSEFIRMQLPYRWELFQVVTTVDASTFQLYMNNMRSLMADILTCTQMAIFNRCNEETTDISYLIRNVKVLNSKAELIFEAENGDILDPGEDILPYDVNQDVIEIDDDNYGIWYLDALDHGERYEGKDVIIKGMVFRSKNFEDGYFVPGRMAMTCCADDITFLGFLCKSKFASRLKNKQWVRVTAEVRLEHRDEYHGIGSGTLCKTYRKGNKAGRRYGLFQLKNMTNMTGGPVQWFLKSIGRGLFI